MTKPKPPRPVRAFMRKAPGPSFGHAEAPILTARLGSDSLPRPTLGLGTLTVRYPLTLTLQIDL